MAKYTRGELKAMADTVLKAINQNDDRAFQLVMMISLKTGMSPDAILKNIKQLAI